MNARGWPLHWLRNGNEVNLQTGFRVKTVHSCLLTSKLCAEVWRTGNEFSLNLGDLETRNGISKEVSSED